MQNPKRLVRSLCAFFLPLLALFACGTMSGQSTTVVISQVYGGGGSTSSSAAYNVDWVELLNISNSPVDISGWSIQYGSSGSKSASITSTNIFTVPANTTPLAAHHYFLIAGTNSAGFGGASITDADFPAGTVTLSASAGKIFLVNSATALNLDANGCPATGATVDFVGYGGSTVNCYEGFGTGGSAAPTTSNASSDIRNGCTDTNNNGSDFTLSTTPTPRNTSSAPASCTTTGPTPFSATAAFTPSTATAGTATLLTATVTPATSPASMNISVTANLTAFGGNSAAVLHDDGMNGDATAGDNIYSYSLTVPGNQSAQGYTVTLTAKDQTTTVNPTAALTVIAPVVASTSITLAASPTSIVTNTQTVLTATVSGNTTAAPTGPVSFYDGGTLLGNGTPSSAGSITTYTYTATLGSPLGTHIVTATYGGDATYPANTTTSPASVNVNVRAVPTSDFTLSVANTSLIATSSAKQQQTIVSVGFIAGFNSPVALSCSGLPSGARCLFAPQTLTSAGDSTLTIGIDGAANHQPSRAAERTSLALAALALPLLLVRRKKLAGTLLALLMLGAFGLSLTGCSGSASTAAGSSTVTVTGTSGSTTHTATFTLVVQ